MRTFRAVGGAWLRGARGNGLGESLRSIPVLEGVLLMTLMLMLLPGQGQLYRLLVGLAVVAMMFRRLRERKWLWLTLVAVRVADHAAAGWYAVDNHHYLLTFWCMALALSFEASHPLKTIRTNARLLIGVCFAFAAAWKVVGDQYVDGSFLAVFFLSRPRESLTVPGTGVPADAVESNQVALEAAWSEIRQVPHVALDGLSPLIEALSMGLGLWTIGIELLIATLFLLPLRSRWTRLGDAGLLAFVGTTYLFAPVLVFGLLLLTMGFARIEQEEVGWRLAYLIGFALLPSTLFGIVGAPGFGLAFTGIALFFGYLYGWGRWLLISGSVSFAAGLGMVVDEGGGASALFFVGLGIVLVRFLDFVFRRGTEQWLVVTGGGALLAAMFLWNSVQPERSVIALAGLIGLLVMASARRLTSPDTAAPEAARAGSCNSRPEASRR